MRVFVTGAAGFIGSNLVDALLQKGYWVKGYDNLSTGREQNLAGAGQHSHFQLCLGDILDLPALTREMAGSDLVFHMAANADVRVGAERPRRDLEQNTIGTWNVLEAMRQSGVRRIAFSSTGSVYGEPNQFPTPENCSFPVQTSLYGASKVAAEALITAYSEAFGIQCHIFRFVSILGRRYSHGHVFDFYRQLMEHPDRLFVLGNGRQRKSYLDVDDCVRGMLWALDEKHERINFLNLGTDEACQVRDSVSWICERLGLNPRIEYSGQTRGWVGDSPMILLDCDKIRSMGWAPFATIRDSVIRTVEFLHSHSEEGCLVREAVMSP